MPRYIDADLLKTDYFALPSTFGTTVSTQYVSLFQILNAPTADVVERKKGKWVRKEIHSNWSDWTEYTCSLCGTTFKRLYEANFCPNCGAEMEVSDAEIH